MKINEDDSLGMLLNVTREPIENEVTDSIKLDGINTETVSFKIPGDAEKGDTFHIICEAQDDSAHNLKHYARVIVTVE